MEKKVVSYDYVEERGREGGKGGREGVTADNLVSGMPSFSWTSLKMTAERALFSSTPRRPMEASSIWAHGSLVPPNDTSWSGTTTMHMYCRERG